MDLFPTAGFASVGFVKKAVRDAHSQGKTKLYVYSLYDFDQAGQTASNALQKSTLSSYGFLFLGVGILRSWLERQAGRKLEYSDKATEKEVL